ncbi:MAG: CotH kinase family protein [Acidobacteria bacterium]|nr:CotH kinase family protein [Acidobacteriota bacterium]
MLPRTALFCPFAVLLLLASPASVAQTSSGFFDDTRLQDIKLTVAPSDWEALKAHYLDNTYYPATFNWNDITLQIGIRSRGRGSRSGIKPNLYLNFDKVVKKQRFLGLEAAVLNGNNQDATHLHNLLSFKLFAHMGLPAPRLALSRLFINGEYFGLYSLVENLDEKFLDRNFGESGGFLYEYKPNQVYNFEWLGADPAAYSPNLFAPQTHEDDPDPRPIVDMVSAINFSSNADFVDSVSAYINPELYLTHAAIENVLTEIDGIVGGVYGMNNFDLYRFDGSKLSQLLVWDKDLTFGQPQREILMGTQENVFTRRLLAIPKYRSVYVNALVTAALTLGSKGGWGDQEVDRAYALIREAATTDPHKQCINSGTIYSCGPAEFERGIQDMHTFIASRASFVLSSVVALPPLDSISVPTLKEVRSSAPYASSSALAPGSLASVWGSGLATSQHVAEGSLPRVIDDVFVSINGTRVPLLMISPEQINFQVPWETQPGMSSLTVSVNGQLSDAADVLIASAAPAIFNVSHTGGSLVDASSPAAPGEALTIWATGLGPVQNPIPSGEPAPSVKSTTIDTPLISLKGTPCTVAYSGLAPGWIGLYQLDFVLAGDAPAGSVAPLELTMSGQTAKIDLSIR